MQNPNEKSILVIGNAFRVGNNDIKNAFVKTFVDQQIPTQAEYFENQKVELKYLDQAYSLTLGTTTGNEEHDGVRPLLYNKKDLIIILFNFSEGNMVTEPLNWLAEIKHFEPHTPVMIVGIEDEGFDLKYYPNKEPKDQTYIRIPTLNVENVNSVFCSVFERLFNIKVERPTLEKYTAESLTELYTHETGSYLKLLPAELYTFFLNYATSKNHSHARLTLFNGVINTESQPAQTVAVPADKTDDEKCLIS